MFKFALSYDENFCRKYPSSIIVFGDNLEGYGKKGQAIIRDQPNSYGVPTKRKPSMSEDSFFSDKPDEYSALKEKLVYLWNQHEKGRKIVLPFNQIGTGLSKIEEKSPKLHEFISRFYNSAKEVQYKEDYENFLKEFDFDINLKESLTLDRFIELECLKDDHENFNLINAYSLEHIFEVREGLEYILWTPQGFKTIGLTEANDLCLKNDFDPELLKKNEVNLFSMCEEAIQDDYLSKIPSSTVQESMSTIAQHTSKESPAKNAALKL